MQAFVYGGVLVGHFENVGGVRRPKPARRKYLLAGDDKGAPAPNAHRQVEAQDPGVVIPDEERDEQKTIGVPQNRARQNHVGLTPQLNGDSLEALPVLAEQSRDVGEALIGGHLHSPLPHRTVVDLVTVPVPQGTQEQEFRPVGDGRIDVLDHLLRPIGEEVRNESLAGRTPQLKLAHHEQAEPAGVRSGEELLPVFK